MKILYIITKSNWGGAQKYVFDLASDMKTWKEDVSVAFGGNGVLAERLKEKDIRSIQIENLERDVDLEKEIQVFKNLYQILKAEKPDIIHLNSSKIGVIGSLIGRIVGIKKIIFTAHGFPFREERPFLQIVLIKFLSWLTIIFSHSTICVSRKDFEDVKDWPLVKKKLIVIHNGIRTEEINKPENIKNDFINIVSIGELHKNKGFEYGLETVSAMKNKIQNFKYTIFSFGGDEEEKLKNMIVDLGLQNFVDLKINKEKHSDFLKDFDIYFMPSIKEGLPYVLLEAGLNSLPLVASDTGGVREIVEHYKNGFLVEPKYINGFELALEKLIENKELRERLGRAAKEKVQTNFSLWRMLEKTRWLYNN